MSNVFLGSASASLNVDASGVDSGVNQANASLARLEQATAQNWWGLRNLGIAFAAFPAIVAAGVASSVKAAVEFETAMAGVARTTRMAALAGESQAETSRRNAEALGELKTELLEISRAKPVATVDVLGVAEAAGALGVAQEDIGRFTETVVDTAAVTDASLDQIATTLARLAAATKTPSAGFDNIASAVLHAGVTTAATEKDILSMSEKVAGVGTAFGASASQIIGISAAARTAGISTAEGATAIAKTFSDINKAVISGGPALDAIVARVGGTREEFQALFQQDAAAGFEKFIVGLSGVAGNAAATSSTLDALGITEARQVKSLQLLAAFQAQNVTTGFKLTEILKGTEGAFRDGNGVARTAAERYKTFESQVQMARNQLAEFKIMVGSGLLGPMKGMVGVLSSFVTGLRAVPGPVRMIGLGIVALVAGASAFLAVLLTIIPRIVQTRMALAQMVVGASQGATSMRGLMTATGEMASMSDRLALAEERAFIAARRAAALEDSRTNKRGRAILASTAYREALDRETAAVNRQAQAMAEAQKRQDRFNAGVSRGGRVLAGLGTFALLASVGVGIFGKKTKDAEKAMKDATKVSDELKRALLNEADGAKGAANAWVTSQAAYQNAQASARALAITEAELLALINGTATPEAYRNFIAKVDEGNKNGVAGARELGDAIRTLMLQYRNTAEEANVVIGATGNLGDASVATADQLASAAAASEEGAAKLQKQAEAHMALVDAMFGVRDAALALRDAENELKDARAGDYAREVAKAEREILDARNDQKRAARDLAKAEDALKYARQDGLDDLAEALDSAADAQDAYFDSLKKVKDQEEKLHELRSGPSLDDLRDATNKLRNAELDLIQAHRGVEDAEWQLAYLRQEGGSARDLEDAELALAEARQKVADADDNRIDSEKELAALTDPIARAEAIAEAERELESARRDVGTATRNQKDAERELQQVRDDVANDTYYQEALNDLIDAQGKVQDSLEATGEAERALQRLRDEGATRDLERATLQYEQALMGVARANVEVKKQQELVKDGTFSVKEEANAMADEMQKLLNVAPSPEARKRMQDYINILRATPDDAPAPGSTAGAGGAGVGSLPGPTTNPLDDLFQPPTDSMSNWEKFKDNFDTILLAVLGSASIFGGRLGGTIADAAKGVGRHLRFVGDSAATAAGDLVKATARMIATASKWAVDMVAKMAYVIAGWVDTAAAAVLSGAKQAAVWTGNMVKNIATSVATFMAGVATTIGGWVSMGASAVASGATQAAVWTGNMVKNIATALASFAIAVATTVGGWIAMAAAALVNAAILAASWVAAFWPFILIAAAVGIAVFLIIKYWDDIVAAAKWVWEKVKEAFGWLKDFLTNAFMNYTPLGFLIKHWDDIKAAAKATWEWIRDNFGNLITFFSELPGKIAGFFVNIASDMFNLGYNIIRGLWDGMIDVLKSFWKWFDDNVVGPIIDNPVVKWVIGSPSKLYRGYGEFLMAGLQEGLSNGLPDVEKMMAQVVDAATIDLTSPSVQSLMPGAPMANAMATPLPAGASGVVHNWQFNLEAHTDADAEQIVSEFMWAKHVNTRD